MKNKKSLPHVAPKFSASHISGGVTQRKTSVRPISFHSEAVCWASFYCRWSRSHICPHFGWIWQFSGSHMTGCRVKPTWQEIYSHTHPHSGLIHTKWSHMKNMVKFQENKHFILPLLQKTKGWWWFNFVVCIYLSVLLANIFH